MEGWRTCYTRRRRRCRLTLFFLHCVFKPLIGPIHAEKINVTPYTVARTSTRPRRRGGLAVWVVLLESASADLQVSIVVLFWWRRKGGGRHGSHHLATQWTTNRGSIGDVDVAFSSMNLPISLVLHLLAPNSLNQSNTSGDNNKTNRRWENGNSKLWDVGKQSFHILLFPSLSTFPSTSRTLTQQP